MRLSEQRQKEALARSEEVFLDLFNATEEIAFLQETDGKILIANNNSARFYEVSSEQYRRQVNL